MEGITHFHLHSLSSKVTGDHVTFEKEKLIGDLPSMHLQYSAVDGMMCVYWKECTYGLCEVCQPLVGLGFVRGIHLLTAVQCVQRL